MKMSSNSSTSLKAWAGAVVLAGVCGMAQAQTIQLSNPGGSVGTSQFLNNFSGGTSYSSQWLGYQGLSANGGSTFTAYCIDPKTTVGFPSGNVYTSASLSSFFADAGGYAGQMTSGGYTSLVGYGNQTNTAVVQSRIQSLYTYAYADSLTSATKASAFGYALWDIMGSSTASNLSRTGDALRSMGSNSTADGDSIETQIDKLFAGVNGGTAAVWLGQGFATATNYIYTVYYDAAPHASQNFLTVTKVAEPGSLALAGLALAGGFLVRRRKVQSS